MLSEQCLQDPDAQDVPRHDFQLSKHGSIYYLPKLCGVGDEILPVCKMHSCRRHASSCITADWYVFPQHLHPLVVAVDVVRRSYTVRATADRRYIIDQVRFRI